MAYKTGDERKKDIMKIAMRLFTEKGYEKTSLRDIAKEANIALGLCYHYFDSKQKLFQEAIHEYIEDYCHDLAIYLHKMDISLDDKLDYMYEKVLHENQNASYHEFFHQKENQELHKQLSIKFCDYMIPHILDALQIDCERAHYKIKDPLQLVSFITYGQIPLVSGDFQLNAENLQTIKEYIKELLQSQKIPE